jgi:hypothetical protein
MEYNTLLIVIGALVAQVKTLQEHNSRLTQQLRDCRCLQEGPSYERPHAHPVVSHEVVQETM